MAIQTTINNLATLPTDGKRYYWAASLGYWAEGDVASAQYWRDDQGRIWVDHPVILDNTYTGRRTEPHLAS